VGEGVVVHVVLGPASGKNVKSRVQFFVLLQNAIILYFCPMKLLVQVYKSFIEF